MQESKVERKRVMSRKKGLNERKKSISIKEKIIEVKKKSWLLALGACGVS